MRRFMTRALLITGLIALGWTQTSQAQEIVYAGPAMGGYAGMNGCSTCAAPISSVHCCQKFHCPPPLKHCMERPPRIHWSHGCPKPICCPCDQPNWGYHQTCWTPWPWPLDWNHCPVTPPAAHVHPGAVAFVPGAPGAVPVITQPVPTPMPVPMPMLETTPVPRKLY